MIEIKGITKEPHQIHRIAFGDSTITLELRYLPIVESWHCNVSYKGAKRNGVRLVLSDRIVDGWLKPFDIKVTDTSGTGVDPVLVDDFSSNRCKLYLLDAAEVAARRGFEVAT
jgi:hypothetical protein